MANLRRGRFETCPYSFRLAAAYGGPIIATSADQEALDALAQVFKRFAKEAHVGGSPLYASLADAIANDPDLLTIASSAAHRPVPNLLFGAVHYLLLSGASHKLSSFYPSLSPDPRPAAEAYPYFREFCLKYEHDIRVLLSSRLVQTNEVARCSYLLPAFAFISDRNPGSPLSIVDIGASAGLHLLWNRYRYQYDAKIVGDQSSPVRIKAEVRGSNPPPIPNTFPPVAFQVGLDLNPVDVTDSDSALWLRALVWPEHERRADRLKSAIDLAITNPPPLMAGDALKTLPTVLDHAPSDSTLCIFHAHTINQFSLDERSRFDSLLDEYSMERDLYLLSAEMLTRQDYTTVELASIRSGTRSTRKLANVDAHGSWLQWAN